MNTSGYYERKYSGGERQVFAPLVQKARQSSGKIRTRKPIYDISPEYYNKEAPVFFRSDCHLNTMNAKHEIVDVRIVIYGLSGLMCEKEIEAPKTSKEMFGWKKKSLFPTPTFQTRSMDSKNWTISTLSSSDASDEGLFPESESNQISALVSITTSFGAHDMVYESFLPSIPLHYPAISDQTARYTALWPAFMEGELAKEQSSFNIVRTIQESRSANRRCQLNSKYVHETVEICLSLSKGTEMMPLGNAIVVLSGDEESEVKMNVRARALENKQKGKQKKKSKSKQNGYFSNDLTKRYYLDKDATLRIGVQVVTQEVKEKVEKQKLRKERFEEQKKQREQESTRLQVLRERMERVSMENTRRRLQMKRQIYFSNFDNDSDGCSIQENQVAISNSRAAGAYPSRMLCIMPNMFCAEETSVQGRERDFVPTGSVILTDDYGYNGLESTISSVSQPLYGSETIGSTTDTEYESSYYTERDY